jgi:virulence-associated protein VapD
MLLSRHQNAGQNRDMEIANRSFENVSQIKYLGTRVTNQNLIHEEIKKRCLLNLLPFFVCCLKNVKIWNTQDYNDACGSEWA